MKNSKSNKEVKQTLQETDLTSCSYHNPSSAKNVPSTTSVKSKKSSNLISAFVKRAMRKNKKQNTVELKNYHEGFDRTSNSSYGNNSEEDNYELGTRKNMFEENSGGEFTLESDRSRILARRNFISKKLKISASKDGIVLSMPSSSENFSQEEQTPKLEPKVVDMSVITPQFIRPKPLVPISLASGLRDVQDLSNDLKERENNIIQMLTKYVRDPDAYKELMNSISNHSKLQWEVERRSTALTNEMWMQQIEINRAQEKTLQEALNSLVKQNRELQIEKEVLHRKNEKTLKKLHVIQDMNSFQENALKTNCCGCEKQIENILMHNEKLQKKLENCFQHLENYENDVQMFQRQNDNLENQLLNSCSEIKSLKSMLQKHKTEYDLEIITLNFKLKTKEQILKETAEAGEIVLEDLKILRQQLKSVPIYIDWNKFKYKENNIIDLVNWCGACLSELSKNLINNYDQLQSKDQEVSILRDTNVRLQESLQHATNELTNANKKLLESSNSHYEIQSYEQKIIELQKSVSLLNSRVDETKSDYENELKTYQDRVRQYEDLAKEMKDKNRIIEENTILLKNICTENYSLHSELAGLQKKIRQTGAGDTRSVKEDDGILFQVNQLKKEKQHYLEEVDQLKESNKKLLERQQKYCLEIEKQIIDMERLKTENFKLKQTAERNNQTITTLQNERKRYLEEKTSLKTIFNHMKGELSRIQKLEGAVVNISKEANKLALIADYNKQIGDKLKEEVVEKDHKIIELRSNVEKLNNIQIENTKEKLSLCQELSEIANLKDQLNEVLSTEIQRNKEMDENQKMMENSTLNQFRMLMEKQKNERKTVKDLFRKLRDAVSERDNLLKNESKYITELKGIKLELDEKSHKLETVTSESIEKDLKIKELVNSLKTNQSLLKKMEENMKTKLCSCQERIRTLEQQTAKLTEEKMELVKSIEYLQNNSQKLHYDLNNVRESEKISVDSFNKINVERAVLEKRIEQIEKEKEQMNQEKFKNIKEIEYLSNLCEKILSDFELSIKTSNEKEESLKYEIETSRTIIMKSNEEIDKLLKDIGLYQSENEKLKDELINLKMSKNEFFQNCSVDSRVQDLQIQLDCKNEQNRFLHEKYHLLIRQKEEALNCVRNHVDYVLKEQEEYKKSMEKEIILLNIQLQELNTTLENERYAYILLSDNHKKITAKFLHKLGHSAENGDQGFEMDQIQCEILENARKENEQLKQQIKNLLDQLKSEKDLLGNLLNEKEKVQKQYGSIIEKYNALEKELEESSEKLSKANVQHLNDQEHLKTAEIRIKQLKQDLDESNELLQHLKEELSKSQQNIAALEFQKCELTLRIHEIQGKLETEMNLCEKTRNTNQHILAVLLRMKEEGKVDLARISSDFLDVNKDSNLEGYSS